MDPRAQTRNEAEPARKFKGVWICAALWCDKALNPTEKFLIAEIDSFTGNGEPCFAGNKYLADHLQASETHMRDMLADLTTRGYLVRLGFNGRQTLRCVRPDLSSNPATSKMLIKQCGSSDSCYRKFPIPNRRYRKNPIPAIGSFRGQKSVKSDTEISNREDKKRSDDDDQLKLPANLATEQSLVVASWPAEDDEPTEILQKLTEKLKLSYDQSQTVQFHLDQDGKEYVLEKLRITRSKDLRNAGGFFIRALEKDYREPVTNTKPVPPPNRKPVQPTPQEPQATDEERAETGAKLRAFVETLRASR
jgi:Helix-turn-helix domain